MALTYEHIGQEQLNIAEVPEVPEPYSKRVQEAARALAEALDYDGLYEESAAIWQYVE